MISRILDRQVIPVDINIYYYVRNYLRLHLPLYAIGIALPFRHADSLRWQGLG